MKSSLCFARSVEAGRRVLNSALMTSMIFGGRGSERVEMARWKRKICTWIIGFEGEMVWDARRVRRARRCFPKTRSAMGGYRFVEDAYFVV